VGIDKEYAWKLQHIPYFFKVNFNFYARVVSFYSQYLNFYTFLFQRLFASFRCLIWWAKACF